MRFHHDFEWDPEKADIDARKHRVTFEDAAAVLADDQAELYHTEGYDDEHSMGEDRFITIASDPADRQIILRICWTERRKKEQVVTRIISARRAILGRGNSMPRPSASGKFVRISADELPARTPRDMARLKAAMDIPVDPSEELKASQLVGPVVRRDASGTIVKRPLGQLRAAILAALDHHKMTRYELWKKAHARCESLSASAVYEYLRGHREIGSEYMEALIEAASLKVVNQGGSKARKPTASPQTAETLEKNPQSPPLLTKKASRPPGSAMKTMPGPSGASKDAGGGKPLPPTTTAGSQSSKTTKKQVGLKGSRSPESVKAGKK